jgi:hypothetical protein
LPVLGELVLPAGGAAWTSAVTDGAERSRGHTGSGRAWAGPGGPAPGVWVSTHADRLNEVEGVLSLAGILTDAQVFVVLPAPWSGVAAAKRFAHESGA